MATARTGWLSAAGAKAAGAGTPAASPTAAWSAACCRLLGEVPVLGVHVTQGVGGVPAQVLVDHGAGAALVGADGRGPVDDGNLLLHVLGVVGQGLGLVARPVDGGVDELVGLGVVVVLVVGRRPRQEQLLAGGQEVGSVNPARTPVFRRPVAGGLARLAGGGGADDGVEGVGGQADADAHLLGLGGQVVHLAGQGGDARLVVEVERDALTCGRARAALARVLAGGGAARHDLPAVRRQQLGRRRRGEREGVGAGVEAQQRARRLGRYGAVGGVGRVVQEGVDPPVLVDQVL